MDLQKFTLKSQEAIARAQSQALERGHQQIDGEHLLAALAEQTDGLFPQLLQKMGVSSQAFRARLEEELDKIPRVSSYGTEAGKVYITPRLNLLLVKAEKEAKKLKDEYASVEHILLAFLEEEEGSSSAALLKEFGITKHRFLEALAGIRGNQRVTSADPEGTYDALQKYGRELVKEARKGKLDPVIGRDAEIRRVIRILSRKTKNNPVLIVS